MVPSETDYWLEILAILAVVALIPFYMGFVHLGIVEVLAYVAVGAILMTFGQAAQWGAISIRQADDLLYEIGLWTLSISLFGGVMYAVALVLV